MKMNKYSFWRMVAGICAGYVSFLFALLILFVHSDERIYYLYALIPISIFMVFSIIHQMIFPLDLRLYVFWVFIFSYIGAAYGTTALSLVIFYCGYILGIESRFLKSKKGLKLGIFIFLYLLSSVFVFRYPKSQLIDKGVDFFITISTILSMHFIFSHMLNRINSDIFEIIQKEDLNFYFSQYSFTDRDKVMLQEVLSGCKYEEIAINHKLSLSSVKKRLAHLYKILGVTCQIDFIVKFSKTEENVTGSTKV